MLLRLSPFELIFKPDLISFPVHITPLSHLSQGLTILTLFDMGGHDAPGDF